MRKVLLALLLTGLAGTAAGAGNWDEPHPWRRQALLEGRVFDYDSDAFLQYFSFRHLSHHPGPREDGLAASVGSITSKRALADVRFRKRFVFDGERQSFILQAERSEDLDGDYSRQLVGFSHQPADDWRLAIRGDVHGDKAESDIWFQGEWQPAQNRNLWLALIFPDNWFNEKTPGDLDYRRKPHTWFARAQLGDQEGSELSITLNHSPAAIIVDTDTGLKARGDQTRAMLTAAWRGDGWRTQLQARGESTRRSFEHARDMPSGADRFQRDMHSATLSLQLDALPRQPEFGLYHLRLEEEGWFGRASNSTGKLVREEPLAYVQMILPGGPRHHWEPAVYVSRPRIFQQVESDQWSDRDSEVWRAKLSLPWRYITDAGNGGILTITPSLDLHDGGFGGGNVQLHWPL